MLVDIDDDVVTVTGEVDVDSGYDLYVAVVDVAQAGAPKVVVDLSGVSFLDSVGLGMLVRCRDDLPRYYESSVELKDPSEPVRRLLDLTALTREFDLTG